MKNEPSRLTTLVTFTKAGHLRVLQVKGQMLSENVYTSVGQMSSMNLIASSRSWNCLLNFLCFFGGDFGSSTGFGPVSISLNNVRFTLLWQDSTFFRSSVVHLLVFFGTGTSCKLCLMTPIKLNSFGLVLLLVIVKLA